LRQNHYTTLAVTQFVDATQRAGSALPERPVVLTFDDGFADFYANALPILTQYGFTATLYIATAFVGGASLWLRHLGESTRAILNWDQLMTINASGIECGAHGHRHVQLDLLPPAEARDEVTRCKSVLEEQLGCAVSSFAYPFGYYNASVQRAVQEAGFSSACAVRYTMSSTADDPFALSRLIVAAGTSIQRFDALLAGRGPVIRSGYERGRALAWHWVRRCLFELRSLSGESEVIS
jgi:peptidoglycan/xylan/chitin deacetylase (PgdA/CDA1 family)